MEDITVHIECAEKDLGKLKSIAHPQYFCGGRVLGGHLGNLLLVFF